MSFISINLKVYQKLKKVNTTTVKV
jgi:hypothetical protein